jgi:hypothetical protein
VIRRHQEAEATPGEELCRGEAGDGAMRGGTLQKRNRCVYHTGGIAVMQKNVCPRAYFCRGALCNCFLPELRDGGGHEREFVQGGEGMSMFDEGSSDLAIA